MWFDDIAIFSCKILLIDICKIRAESRKEDIWCIVLLKIYQPVALSPPNANGKGRIH